ncbi:NAD(+)/NADH kinase [Ilumatobacter sp.]|uniref:NAD(+)/NADH kinase n=1 Tax=Ilumatobacter sp. TaxID=1967498 RepID=UPI003B51B203
MVNPHAGKDIRRLVSAAGSTSDAVKIGIVRRAAIGALEQGAERVLLSSDTHHLAERAVDGIDGRVELLDSPLSGSHHDTIAAARELFKREAGAVIVLGGDGTCRDMATGWPDVPLIPISTGTNNVFPTDVDGTSAGVAAALVATGAVPLADVGAPANRITIDIDDPRRDRAVSEIALVEAALIDAAFVGARAVSDPSSVRWVVACIADPSATGLSSIAGRVHPVARDRPGAVLIHLGPGGRSVRVPLAPGSFSTLDVASVEALEPARSVELPGGGVLAYDGERTTPVSAEATVTVRVEPGGPRVIDVAAALERAAGERRFDLRSSDTASHGSTDTTTDRTTDAANRTTTHSAASRDEREDPDGH